MSTQITVGIPPHALKLLAVLTKWIDLPFPGNEERILSVKVFWGTQSKLKVELDMILQYHPQGAELKTYEFKEAGREQWGALNEWLCEHSGLEPLEIVQDVEVGFEIEDVGYYKIQGLIGRNDK